MIEQRIAEACRAEREQEMLVTPLRLVSGEKYQVEEDTTKLLAADRRRQPPPEDYPWLSPEQYILRRGKEIFNSQGVPDASLMRGQYRKCHNPEFGKRPGKQRAGGDD